ncbi:sec-independent protein translocase protein TatB [Mesocricetibacter intestinalis]|uniref:Sec-independent protein translocase protein TatB n=1 Tax=Mesocricetibacter intestinalis TaxID=1521930 RepID=A0A4R6VBE8_9PAST|nr:Sec-independent protein translocase protein TatB [Mesocricetibacter intestinalis]TDQ59588.1 sec-independent protein translocase protein TatB [Mesocricetibacter intestinalis]
MFDIGFSELILVFIVGLVVLGPQRLPVAVRTVMGWVRTVRGLAANVQNELTQELKLQELQESIKKAENLNLRSLSPDLAKTVDELKASADKMKTDLENKAAQANTTLERQIETLREENAEKNGLNGQASTAPHPEKSILAQETAENKKTAADSSALSEASESETSALDEQLAYYINEYHPGEEGGLQRATSSDAKDGRTETK